MTPGYYREPALTREAFDDEGFDRIGDAMKLADPDDPSKGLVFDGRVAETFKLSSGTWAQGYRGSLGAGASAHCSFTDWCPEFRDYRC